jgi:nicotinamide riboside kinase
MPHVVLTGTESTYKTRLCEALSEWLDIRSVPEYAREYMRENKLDVTGLNEAVFNTIATGQIEQQRSNGYYNVHADPVLFDTDGITLAVWAADKFQSNAEEFSAVPKHLHYLLCAPTNRAYEDPLREDLTRRTELHQRYVDMLDAVNASYTILNEVAFEDRLLEAKSVLKSLGFTPHD